MNSSSTAKQLKHTYPECPSVASTVSAHNSREEEDMCPSPPALVCHLIFKIHYFRDLQVWKSGSQEGSGGGEMSFC